MKLTNKCDINMKLATEERTKFIYEDIPTYQQPPQIPLMSLSLAEAYRSLHLKKTLLSRCALWLLNVPTGFSRFYKALPEHLDEMLKTYDLRRSSLQAPIISATLTLQDDPRTDNPLDRAVSLLLGAKSFYDDLINGRLEQDRYGNAELEMGQYPNLFSTNLTVENRKSRIFKSARTDQITILVNRQIYLMTIENWDSASAFSELKSMLETIVQHSSSIEKLQPPIGLVTSASQVVQVRGISRMQANPMNQNNIEKLKHSFVTICLDLDKYPQDESEAFVNSHAGNPENRWSWQSLQLVVHGNGKACAVCNFSVYLDGNTMMRGAAEICHRGTEIAIEKSSKPLNNNTFEHLQWQVNPQLLEAANRDFEKIKDDQQATFVLQTLSKTVAQQMNVDAVGVFVLALCMTTQRHVKKLPVVHQFLTMSKYRYMDLTTAIVSTPEVQTFCDFMKKHANDKSNGYELLIQAIDSQKQACRDERSAFSLVTIYSMFLMSQQGIKKIWAVLNFMFAEFVLRKTKHLSQSRRDIVISHPAIYPEITMVGRPGVRLPYVTYFALHYQIFQDRTIVTMMPGLRWCVPNEKLIAELNANIQAIIEIVKNVKTNEPSP
jgi:hypothetical protein